MTRVVPAFLGVSPDIQSLLGAEDSEEARASIGAGTGDGDVSGPGGVTAKRLSVFGDTTGKLLAESSGLTLAEQGQARADLGAGVLAGFRNKIINPRFDIWQRGPALNNVTGGVYTADRAFIYTGNVGQATITRQAFPVGGSESIPGRPEYIFQYQQNIASTAGGFIWGQKLENVRLYSAQKFTLNFWARVLSGTLQITPRFVQDFGVGASTSVATDAAPVTFTTTWQRFTMTVDIPSEAGKTILQGNHLGIYLLLPTGTTFTAQLAQMAFVPGDATMEEDPSAPRHIQQELALCQRYFEAPPLTSTCLVRYASIYAHSSNIPFKAEKRVTPSMTISINGSLWSDGSSSPVLYNAGASTSSFAPIFSLTGGAVGGVGQMAFFYVADAEL